MVVGGGVVNVAVVVVVVVRLCAWLFACLVVYNELAVIFLVALPVFVVAIASL